jgi:hypothetical protein
MLKLDLYSKYNREQIAGIFAPDTKFQKSVGVWGALGLIELAERPGDFVFMITIGTTQGGHEFDEGISPSGVFYWQSQPRQGFQDEKIKKLIDHDELRNNIYLFARSSKGEDYIYFGKLKYLNHDAERSNPVHFQWQLINLPIPNSVIVENSKLFTSFEAHDPGSAGIEAISDSPIKLTEPPVKKIRMGSDSQNFKRRLKPDYGEIDAKNRALGLAGEKLVIEYEKKRLTDLGKLDLVSKVRHVAELEGDGPGYDIESCNDDGTIRFIEVKTTRSGNATPFFLTRNEYCFSILQKKSYFLYRVFNYNEESNKGEMYILNGPLDDSCELLPTVYKAIAKVSHG